MKDKRKGHGAVDKPSLEQGTVALVQLGLMVGWQIR